MGSRVEQFEQIRWDRDREGLSLRALARRHGVHRRTVKQALASPVPPAKREPPRGESSSLRPEPHSHFYKQHRNSRLNYGPLAAPRCSLRCRIGRRDAMPSLIADSPVPDSYLRVRRKRSFLGKTGTQNPLAGVDSEPLNVAGMINL